MTLKFWKWGREKTISAPINDSKSVDYPFLTISVSKDGRINPYCYFPEYGEQEMVEVAKHFATLLFLLNNGSLITFLQKAVVSGGDDSPVCEQFAHLVMACLNVMNQEAHGSGQTNKNKLVVRPSHTFGFNLKDSPRND